VSQPVSSFPRFCFESAAIDWIEFPGAFLGGPSYAAHAVHYV
jgi:hypothetical protein